MAAEWNVSPYRLNTKQQEAFTDAQTTAAIHEFDTINAARRSSRAMKVIGTVGLFSLGAVAVVTALIASGGTLAAPTAAAMMLAAESSGAGTGISGILTGVGIGRESFNKRQLKKVRHTYGLV